MTKAATNNLAGKTTAKKITGAALGLVIGVITAFALHPEGLGTQGVLVLSILAGAIVWWIFDVLAEYATALLMVVLFVLVARISPEAALGMFSNPTWWILVGAFSIGLGMRTTGLLRRMALAIVSVFPPSFAAQAAGFITCGTLLGPLIPSMAAKVSLLGPLALEIGDDLGYERQGREDTGLFLAMFTGVQNVAPAVISASVIGYALLALYPADVQAQFDFLGWLLAALPWFLPLTIINFLLIYMGYRPRKGRQANGHPSEEEAHALATSPHGNALAGASSNTLSDAAADTSSNTGATSCDPKASIRERRQALGPLSRHERLMSVITLLTVLAWVTQGVHGVSAWIPAVCALVAMAACGIITKENFGSGLGWASLIFIGIVLGLGDVFAEAGINVWIVDAFGPAVTAIASNPYTLIAGVALITVAARFLVVSQIAFLNIFMAFVIPIAITVGVNPWVIGMASYAVLSPWFVKYQNPIYLAAYYSVDGEMAKHSRLALYCVPYTIASIASLFIAVPFWQAMGLL